VTWITSPRRTRLAFVAAVAAAGLAASIAPAAAGSDRDDMRRDRGRGEIVIKKQGYFYVGGQYDSAANPTSMTGQMYVEYQIPADRRSGPLRKLPIVMIHGGGHTGASWQTRPDGGEGWADYFLKRGWPVYIVDRPGVAKSTSLGAFGNVTNVRTALDRFAASELASPTVQWPQADLHTQWPGGTTQGPGDPDFDQYYAHLAPGGTAGGENNQVAATVALLDKIGPAILMPHSAPGPGVWRVGDQRPSLVKGIVAVEPSGPPFYEAPRFGMPGGELTQPWGISAGPLTYDPPVSDPAEIGRVQQTAPDAPGLIPCWMQSTPARRLPELARVPTLMVLGEASYHAPYDHCTSKYLSQAGVRNDFVRLADRGIRGNGHIMFVEKNNLKIAGLIEDWLINELTAPKKGR
jgi:pimeloyl-ACP methyl ester carboxylesterase